MEARGTTSTADDHERGLDDLNQAEDQLLQILACLPPRATPDELARALPEGTTAEDVAPHLAALAAAGLVDRDDEAITVPDTLRTGTALATGLPLAAFEDLLTLDHLKHAVRTLRTTLTEADVTGELPPWGPPRKAGLVDELAGMLATPDAAAAAVRGAPPEAAAILRHLLDGPHTAVVDHPLVHYRVAHRRSTQLAHRPDYADSPAYWLYERGLILPVPDAETADGTTPATVTRELLLSWQGGRPVAELDLHPPPLDATPVDDGEVDTEAADVIGRTLQALDDLLDTWSEDPPTALKDGGLGAKALGAVATLLGRAVEDAARIVELAHLAGLITVVATPGGTTPGGTTVVVAPAAQPWQASPPAARWTQLATAWLRAGTWPSRAGRATDGDALRPALLVHHPDPAPVRARAGLVASLHAIPVGRAVTPGDLAARVRWDRPRHWADAPPGPDTAIAWTIEEAALLGLVALGSLTTFARALLDGDRDRAQATLDAALPPVSTTFTLQADLTAVVIGRLDYDVATELRLLADVESTGSASTYRFSDATLRRALDAGRDAEAITAFLDAHADRGVPSALTYLVADVARRHGHLTVTPAATILTGDDPAVVAEAASHRGTRALGLHLLAPTVAVSPRPPAEVMATLRDAGFLPVPGPDPTGALTLTRAPVGPTAATAAPARPTPPQEPYATGPVAAPVAEAGRPDRPRR